MATSGSPPGSSYLICFMRRFRSTASSGAHLQRRSYQGSDHHHPGSNRTGRQGTRRLMSEDRSPLGTFAECPVCAGEMNPEHAHTAARNGGGWTPAATFQIV